MPGKKRKLMSLRAVALARWRRSNLPLSEIYLNEKVAHRTGVRRKCRANTLATTLAKIKRETGKKCSFSFYYTYLRVYLYRLRRHHRQWCARRSTGWSYTGLERSSRTCLRRGCACPAFGSVRRRNNRFKMLFRFDPHFRSHHVCLHGVYSLPAF